MRVVVTILFCALFAGTFITSGSSAAISAPDARTALSGIWKIHAGDSPAFAGLEFDDSRWDDTGIPGSFMRYVLQQYGSVKGIVWLRKTITVDTALRGQGIGLSLGKIAQADETFFNGVKIGATGSFPPDDFSAWNSPRHYFVPSHLIRYGGENTIAVRVSCYLYGEMTGAIQASPLPLWNRDRERDRFLSSTLPFCVIAMGLILFGIFFFFFVLRPGEQEYLFFCLSILFGSLIVLDLCTIWNIHIGTPARFRIVGISWVVLNVVHLLFLHRFYGFTRPRIEKALWSYCAVMCAFAAVIPESALRQGGLLLIPLTTMLGIYHFSCHITAIHRKRPFARIFGVFGAITIAGAIHDGIVYFLRFTMHPFALFGCRFEGMIFHLGAVALFAGTSLVLVYRFILLAEEVEVKNLGMEHYIIDTALLRGGAASQQNAGAPLLSPGGEDKINRVISYINENYRSDISREGLASSVDIHPDNLSKLFSAHKNMRISDYINELRIRDAARLLADGDERVIDIAFSVGFESVRTFNRAFLKYMDATPEQYRKEHRNQAELRQ